MSEMCNSSTSPHDTKFHTILLTEIFFFLSFILSHPLYFSYFIFFFPYLLKILSFLSPLFLTTTLLLLLSFSLSIRAGDPTFKHNHGYFLSTFLKFTEKLGSKDTQENHQEMPNFEEFEVYKIVFDHHMIREIPIEVSDSGSDCVTKLCTHEEVSKVITTGERKLGKFHELLEKFENMHKEKKVADHHDESPCPKSNKVVGKLQKDLFTRSEATTIINNDCGTVNVGTTTTTTTDNGAEYELKSKGASNAHPEKNGENVNYGGGGGGGGEYTLNSNISDSFDLSNGWMRKEKEWKRTLACKLFEERHNVGGKDGMDSLWETYDEEDLSSNKDAKKAIDKSKSDTNTKKNNRKKSESNEYYYDFDIKEADEVEDEDEDEDEDVINGPICCLQALKMSSGKMNFGMRKTNFVKISRALKGIGWLHYGSKHGKKR